jgi:phosphoglycolate phosphatase-like HAD superfamily hydrolase
MKLFLFDIDGTLIDSGGAGTRALELAFKELFSIRHAFQGIAMAGKTDIEIIKEALNKYQIPANDGVIPAVTSSYLRHLSVEVHNDRKHLKPGVRDVLDRLSERPDCHLGLLTGNIEEGARIKLGAFDLNRYFSFGAFGSDNEDRRKLLPLAVKKFKNITGKTVNYSSCIVIGDTPRDVHCAKPYGALSVAVATGPYAVEHLRETGADVVLRTLSDGGALFKLLD